MPDRIEKDIDFDTFPEKWRASASMVECWILAQLKEAGMPLDGTLLFRGVKRGTLTAFDDMEKPNIRHFIWKA